MSGTAGVARSIESQNSMAAKLKFNFSSFCFGTPCHRSPYRRKKQILNIVGTLSFRGGKESFGFKKFLMGARLDTCLRLSSIVEVVSRRCKLRETGD